ncbi:MULTISPECIES: carbonic anhydrase [unclassified Leucobacter]|uniref:carbonic anhydrase n=1 Tax=unclassified Leucobacter TaxID=2621730 RepID=UPI001BFD4FB6|nr:MULTISPECIES: carbonic anhydrase [unclassified Leucobacter]
MGNSQHGEHGNHDNRPEAPPQGTNEERVLQIHWVAQSDRPAPIAAATPAEALELLSAGSRAFGSLGSRGGVIKMHLDPEAFGFVNTSDNDGILNQEPFAAVLSCSDARVPIEIALGRGANDLFVVRVAGNVPGAACLGSLHYASEHLPRVQLFSVIGHSQCGAVTAAVDALLNPGMYLPIAQLAPLREIVDSIFGSVRLAAYAIAQITGNATFISAAHSPELREVLIAVSAVANSALGANVVARNLGREAAFGIYDLGERTIGSMRADGWEAGLRMAPMTDADLTAVIREAAEGHLAAAGLA